MTADQIQSLGEYLRQERDRLGITLEQVASATKIGVKTLQALESDHYADLPAKPFIRGFVISYSRFIGLDAKEVLTQYGRFIDERYTERPNRESDYSGYAFEKREGEQSRTILWLVMGGFIVFGGVVILFLKPSLHHHHTGHIEKLKEVEASASASPLAVSSPMPSASVSGVVAAAVAPAPSSSPIAASPLPSPVAKATPSPKAAAVVAASETPKFQSPAVPLVLAPSPTPSALAKSEAPSPSATPSSTAAGAGENIDPLNSGKDYPVSSLKYKIVFKALENVQVRYKVDQKPAMRFVLKQDKVLVLRAQSTIIFQTANPKVVSVKGNGQQEELVNDAGAALTSDGFATLYYPAQPIDKTKKPLDGESFQKQLSH